MNRACAIALFLCAPLLMTQRAAAQDCFCGVAPTFGMPASTADELPASETRDTTIQSTVSVVFIAAVTPTRAPATPAVLWCTSGNDPRCMPLHASDAPELRSLSGGPVAVGVDLTQLRVSRIARELSSMTPAEGLPSALGVQRSLDRPPRG
jgi:hypothetical protein